VGSGEEILKCFVVVDIRGLEVSHIDVVGVHEPPDLFLRGRCALIPSFVSS
jgi:hypothetical protein